MTMVRSKMSSPLPGAEPAPVTGSLLAVDAIGDFDSITLIDSQGSLPAGGLDGTVLLVIGASADLLADLLAELLPAATAAAAVIARPPALPDAQISLAELAASVGTNLRWLPDSLSWTELHRQLIDLLTPPPVAADESLADLAQTIATLTGGLVTIEDTSARVLAYSRSSDEVDDRRRLSILGRSGPPAYLALLRDWGIYDRLASSEEVVEIAEHPESGIRRRLAVGIFAGGRPLGTIWVQQGSVPFGPHARGALLGAARITAAHLVDRRGSAPSPPTAAAGLSALLTGQAGGLPVLGTRSARRPCAVAVFDLGNLPRDRAEHRLLLDELSAIISVHAVSYRRDAVSTVLDGRICLLLPSLESVVATLPTLDTALAAARTHLDPEIRCAIGPIAPEISAATDSLSGALLALTAEPQGDAVITFDNARPSLIVAAATDAVAARVDLIDPAISRLVQDESELAATLLAYLDHGGQVAETAEVSHVHVTTVRYRLRRAAQLTGIDLDNADQRLATHLQLRFSLRVPPHKA
jgi:DNA-binding PucR family transcriptional regulator